MRSAREASSSSDGTQRVSLKDIADELGISQTAVSFLAQSKRLWFAVPPMPIPERGDERIQGLGVAQARGWRYPRRFASR